MLTTDSYMCALGPRLVEFTDRIAVERCDAIAHRVGPFVADHVAGLGI